MTKSLSSVLRSIPTCRRIRPFSDVLVEFPRELVHEEIETPGPARSPDEEAREILERARKEALLIVEGAREEAGRLIDEAQAEAEQLRAQAQAQGALEGETLAREEFAQEVKRLLEALAAARDEVADLREAALAEAEAELVKLAFEVAEHIVRREASLDPNLVLNIIREALGEIRDKGRIRLRVNAWDLEKVRESREDILRWAKDAHAIEIVEDPGVEQGGCVLETDFGSVDARLTTRLLRVRKAFEAELEGGYRDEHPGRELT